jgi:hypothetical protein
VTTDPKLGKGRLGFEMKVGPPVGTGKSGNGWMLEDFEDLTPYMGDKGAAATANYVIGANQAGQTSEGVTQTFESITEGARVGQRCGRYTATSTRKDDFGWSAIGRTLDKPLDLREHVALGMWVYGDGSGAMLKIQPRDQNGNAQDHYFPITFKGWRYIVMRRPDKPSPMPIEYNQITRVIFYYNGIPAGKTCTVLMDGLEALRTPDGPRTPPPSLSRDAKSVSFQTTVGLDDVLLYVAGRQAQLVKADGKLVPVAVKGDLGVLPEGQSEVSLQVPQTASGRRVMMIKPMIVYEGQR